MKHQQKIREFSNGEITVEWNKNKCIQDGICVQHLSSVFKGDEEPNLKGASTKEIIETVAKCSTGAIKIKIGSHEWM